MFFKNAIVYRFTQPFKIHPLELHEKLAQLQSRQPGALETTTYGFTSPTHTNALVVYDNLNTLFIATKRIDKVVPAAAVNEILADRIAQLEEEQARKLPKKERQQLKDSIIDEILPNALTKSAITHAFIDFKKQWIVVDAASAKKAEDLLSLLRKANGHLPVVPLRVNQDQAAPYIQMTGWRTNPSESFAFNIEQEAQLIGPEDEKITIKGVDLFTDEVIELINSGMMITKIALTHRDALTFVLDDGLYIKRIKPLDTYSEHLANYYESSEPTDAYEAFICNALLMSSYLLNMLTALGAEFGGFEEMEDEEDISL